MTADDIHAQLEKIDVQILRLLEERVQLMADLSDDERAEARDGETEVVAFWQEEAADRDLDEAIIDKICRLALLLCRRGGQE